MFDIFYSGVKPNLCSHEREATSIEQAQHLSRTRYFWWVTYLADLNDVDLLWEPSPWESHQRHAWASQHQKDAGVYLVPKDWNGTDTNYHSEKIIRKAGVPVVEIDHLDGHAGQIPNTIKTVRYFDNYRDVLIRIAKSLKGQHEYVWICSSCCDYSNFDFSWHPDPWQLKLLHVFPILFSKFGDTFLMHVDSFAERAEQFELLDWYDLNFVSTNPVLRRPLPVIKHKFDTHVEAVKRIEFPGPLAIFSNNTTMDTNGYPEPAVPLWHEKTKTIVPLSKGATDVIVPKAAIPYIKTQLYDYPHIEKKYINDRIELPLDIVFIENGESNAADNWMMLENRIVNLEPNCLHRVSNVKGRAAAYHAAAQASTTPWFFAVFAKLAIDLSFDWSWQPDRMQQPKHYIFHAKNPVNGLVYGHQAMIAYNKQLVLNNPGIGLDFTLDSPHEVVPLLSGTADYAQTKWSAWRTAFRECLKLCGQQDVESTYRLNRWLTKDNTDDKYSMKGAEDAVEYYNEVNGDFDALKKSYEWDWLASYALIKRNLTPAD